MFVFSDRLGPEQRILTTTTGIYQNVTYIYINMNQTIMSRLTIEPKYGDIKPLKKSDTGKRKLYAKKNIQGNNVAYKKK